MHSSTGMTYKDADPYFLDAAPFGGALLGSFLVALAALLGAFANATCLYVKGSGEVESQ